MVATAAYRPAPAGNPYAVSGHVFVVHGDLTHLACDDWLLPTDRELTLTDAWLPTLRDDAVRRGDDGVPRLAAAVSDSFCAGTRRVVAVPEEARAEPAEDSPVTRGRAWLLDIGDEQDVGVDWLVSGVREWLDACTAEASRSDRALPLLGLPLVGTGAGGAATRRDEVLAELLPALHEHAERCGVDIALVLNDARDHAAAQAVRARLQQGEDADCWDLDKSLLDAADELAAHATEGRLALFLGAGVSRAAGLPVWDELIGELLDTAGVGADERAAVSRLEVPDQAEYVARRLPGGGDELRDWVRRRFAARPHALAHALLAALPVRETVSTNWDPLFERAVRDTGRALPVIPYDDPAGSDRWLLKLHGDAHHGDGIVVRRSDYLRFAAEQNALAGVVQSLLFTRHMLFVGFSLVDENFIRIADDVTRLVDRYGGRAHEQREHSGTRRLGTTLALHHDPAKPVLWPHLEHLVVTPAGGGEPPDQANAEAAAAQARRLEIFLDLLSARVDRGQLFLLDERYAGLLDEADRLLAERLAGLAESADELSGSSSWPRVQALLSNLGDPSCVHMGTPPGDRA